MYKNMYFDEIGSGEDVLFIHGYISDSSVWENVKNNWNGNEHLVFPTLGGFYSKDRSPDLNEFDLKTHLNQIIDLVENHLRKPVNLVGWSYGATLSLLLAVKRPDLFKNVFLYEPGISSFIKDENVLNEIQNDRAKMAAKAIKNYSNGDLKSSIKEVVDGACNDNVFESFSNEEKNYFLNNSYTIPMMFKDKKAPDLDISYDDIKNVKTKIFISYGARARPAYKLVADELNKINNNFKVVVIPNAYHVVPVNNAKAFISSVKNSFEI